MIGINGAAGSGRVLDFDIENRPLSYWQPDRPTAEVTAIAMAWVGDPDSLQVVLLGRESLVDMLLCFRSWYNQADVVTGHYIRMHDLPILNGALIEMGLPILGSKMSSDTKLDMVRKADIPATQEFLLETLGIETSKYHMTQAKWREANRLTERGMAEAEKRVSSDVIGHMAMREEMLRRGLLRGPRLWSP